MEKQTAVEWLVEKLNQCEPMYSGIQNNEHKEYLDILIEQAKIMEEEQITDAYNKGLSFAINPIPKPEDAKNYYKKSIKKTNDTRRKSKGII